MASSTQSRQTVLVVSAFAALYIIWGSTYLAIRVALGGFPPFILGSLRFIIAGLLMLCWFAARGEKIPTLSQWKSATLVGALLLIGGNGGVVWAEQSIDSGMVSLIASSMPFWVVLIDWIRPKGTAPSRAVMAGLFVGIIGVALLIGPSVGSRPLDPVGVLCVVGGSFAWAAGSLLSKSVDLPKNPLVATAMEMLCGGILLALVALFSGEWSHFQVAQVTMPQFGALTYLMVFGSIIGYSAFIWLLTVVPPARVSTYAYINPMVAVFLGWVFLHEPIGIHTVVAASVILVSVALITTAQGRSKRPAEITELENEILGPAQALPVPAGVHQE